MFCSRIIRLLSALGLAMAVAAPAQADGDPQALAVAAQQIFQNHCTSCHGEGPKPKSALNLLDHDFIVSSNRKIIVQGDADASEVIRQIAKGKMPPQGKNPLTPEETQVIRDWISAGAPAVAAAADPVQPVVKFAVPTDFPPDLPSASSLGDLVKSNDAVAASQVNTGGAGSISRPVGPGPEIGPGGPGVVVPGGSLTSAGLSYDSPLGAQVKGIFTAKCFKCHGDKKVAGDLRILDCQSLVAKNLVALGNPEKSELFKRIAAKKSDDMMPPEELPRLAPGEIALIHDWIAGNAGTVTPVTKEDVAIVAKLGAEYILDSIYQDVHRLKPADREYVRYLSFTHILVAGATSEQLEIQREALFKVVNHMTWSANLVAPVAIERTNTIYRIDLRQLGWNHLVYGANAKSDYSKTNLFDLALLEYPYGIIYDRSLAYKSLLAEYFPYTHQVRPIAYVRSDWFCSVAAQPPLYHDFLRLPEKLEYLEYGLGVRSQYDLDNYKAVRAGMGVSGVSRNNRVVERHSQKYGTYWKSFDFKTSSAQENMYKDPIDLHETGGEMVFSLPNGLHGYYVCTAKGDRLDEAPIDIVTDKFAANKTVRNGLACMRCHGGLGLQTFKDTVRPVLKTIQGNPGFLVDRALHLYPEQKFMDRLFSADTQRFSERMKLLVPKPVIDEPLTPVSHNFLDEPINLAQASAEMGRAEPGDLQGVFRLPQFAQLGLAPLAVGGEIRRDSWEDYYDRVVRQMGIGVPIVPLDSIIHADYSPTYPVPFELTVKTNKGNNFFEKSDTLQIVVKSNADVYVEIIYTSSKGHKTIVVPSKTLVKAGKEFKYPEKGWELKNRNPGKEHITVFASTAYFPPGEVFKAENIADRVFHPFLINKSARAFEVRFNPDPMKTIKKTIEVEIR